MEWHDWRKLGIGASDAPVIMGVSPWSTPYKLWEIKTGIRAHDESGGNWATQRGNELEAVARSHYELIHDYDMPATLAVHEQHDWLRASLDGYNKERNIVLEIKCPGKADHELARSGNVPEKYWPQLQHQLMVTGARAVHYFSFDGESSTALVSVKPDESYIAELFEREHAFWKQVLAKTPPPLSDKDVKQSDDTEMIAAAEELAMIQDQIKQAEAVADSIKKKLAAATDHPIVQFGRVRCQRIYRAGSIDYKAMGELQNVDLEKYRKPGTEYFSFKIDKKPC